MTADLALRQMAFTNKNIFNKWHQERALQMTIKKEQIGEMGNQKYLNIVIDTVKDSMVAKLVKWTQQCNEQHKKVSTIHMSIHVS